MSLYLILAPSRTASPEWKRNCAKKTDNSTQIYGQQTFSKLSAVVAMANFQQKEHNKSL
jgi:hypothetical protein